MRGNLLAELPLADSPEGAVFSATEDRRRLPPFGDWYLTTAIHGATDDAGITGLLQMIEESSVAP